MREWGLGVSRMVEGRCAKGVCGWSLTVSINLPFILFTFRLLSTHVGCLLATGFLG